VKVMLHSTSTVCPSFNFILQLSVAVFGRNAYTLRKGTGFTIYLASVIHSTLSCAPVLDGTVTYQAYERTSTSNLVCVCAGFCTFSVDFGSARSSKKFSLAAILHMDA
jgi:hypothetical protein